METGKLLLIIAVAGGMVFSAVTGCFAEVEKATLLDSTEPAPVSSPKIVKETGKPEAAAPENPVPLSKREDIILISKFFRGMGKGDVPKGWELDDKKKPIDISLVKEEDQIAVRFKSNSPPI